MTPDEAADIIERFNACDDGGDLPPMVAEAYRVHRETYARGVVELPPTAMPAPSRIAKVVIAGQDFVPASALDKLHELLDDALDVASSGHGQLVRQNEVARIRREAAKA